VPARNHDVDRLPMYGMPTWGDAFTARQLVALTTFSDLVGEARERVLRDALSTGMAEGERLEEGGTGAAAYADAVATYLAAGAVGLPVFAGGTSTLALVGPSAGFLFGFLPGVVVIALLRGKSDTSSFAAAARTAGRYLLAALVGGVVVVYALGFVIQSALTGAPLAAVALASMGFVVGDAIKAVVASLAAAGLSKLGR